MDGQHLWNQNYCSVCDRLIEPGSGVGLQASSSSSSKTAAAVAPTATTFRKGSTASSAASSPTVASQLSPSSRGAGASGLKSNSGTVKQKYTEGTIKRANGKGKEKAASTGPRRNNSHGSRLNALSGLKPTTKLHGDDPAAPASKQLGHRRGSSIGSKLDTTTASDAEAPAASTATLLQRSKKGGLLALASAQLEDDGNQDQAPLPLYCSETCRDIDQQVTPAGLVELNQLYVSQPGSYSNPWAPQWSPDLPLQQASRVWPRTASMTSIPAYAGSNSSVKAFETESSAPCTCQDCMDKNSASGTVPSWASDTTESSNGYVLGRGGGAAGTSSARYQKQRTRSGRIMTPQNLNPPSGGEEGYFPRMSEASRRKQSVSSVTSNPGGRSLQGVASSEASGDSSAPSMGSYQSFWEPRVKAGRSQKQTAGQTDEGAPSSAATMTFSKGSGAMNRTRDSTISGISLGTQGTVTPSVGSMTTNATVVPAAHSLGSSLTVGSSPLRLLRQGDHRAAASVDVSTNEAQSPPNRPMGTSLASERTLGTSAQTVAADGRLRTSSRDRANRQTRARSMLLHLPDEDSRGGRSSPAISVQSPDESLGLASPGASSMSLTASAGPADAMSALRTAASGSQPTSRDTKIATNDPRRHSSGGSLLFPVSSSGWLKSLSSAWTSLRAPQLQSQRSQQDDSSFSSSSLLAPNSTSSRRSSDGSGISSDRPTTINSSNSNNSDRRSSAASDASGLSRSLATESLSKVLSSTQLDRHDGATVTRPGANRGRVPAFAREIGQGQIPGEQGSSRVNDARLAATSRSPPSPRSQDHAGQQQQDRHDSSASQHHPMATSYRSRHGTGEDEEERRRRRKAEQRHQRSKDVTMLPPLLAPSNRTNSSSNLHRPGRSHSYVHMPQQGRNSSRGRDPAGSGATFMVGSAGSPSLIIGGIHRPVTPNAIAAARARLSGARSPEIVLNGKDKGMTPDGLPRAASTQDMVSSARPGTSPRRTPGLGAMTPIRSPPSGGSGSTAAGHRSTASGHRHTTSGSSSGSGTHVPLGHVGMLGYHPHGSTPINGRHHTMPVRTSTPIVPEHGGEMSGAALTGQGEDGMIEQPRRGSYHQYHHRHHGHHRAAPPSQLNRLAAAQPKSGDASRNWSYDNLAAITGSNNVAGPERKRFSGSSMTSTVPISPITTAFGPQASGLPPSEQEVRESRTTGLYPVLQVPNAKEAHDRYENDPWKEAVKSILSQGPVTGREVEEEVMKMRGGDFAGEERESAGGARRKQLFHFGP